VAIRILEALERYARTEHGAVKKLVQSREYRMRVGDWRIRFERLPGDELVVTRILHRSRAYRE
jgi:mRNA-degrading endonuclease RelE of RelBE toxin-antitoxin system